MGRNIKLLLAYDGTAYHGWQMQPKHPTIQKALHQTLWRVLGGPTQPPEASGRTDAGVHALGQVVTFRTDKPIPVENLTAALNDVLPADIRVLSAEEVAPDFHPRDCAKAKTYRYRLLRSEVCPPFLARFVNHYPYPLDEAAMIAAARSSKANTISLRSLPLIRRKARRRQPQQSADDLFLRDGGARVTN